jgi:nitrate reductase delta subunit
MKLRSRAPAAQQVYKLCSLLLCYPDEQLLEARAELAAAAGREFDLHKRCSLYLTFYGQGDRRDRGVALLRLKRMYRAAGLPLEGPELPDYLPVMLEFAATAPRGRGEIVLREHRPALELLRRALEDRGTPYADVLGAVCSTLGEPSAADRARAIKLAAAGPPSELVGLEPFAPPEVMPVTADVVPVTEGPR